VIQKRVALFILCALCVLLTACGAPNVAQEQPVAYTVTDIEGTKVDFSAPPKRIVTLSMSTDETMLGLVEPERMAAVNTLLDDPVSSNITELAKAIPQRIGDPTVEEIMALPQGYDTVLTKDAENISVGQRQLLTIARVFLCDPAILILDEATSSVDTRTEMEIGTAMKALMKDRTSFVIAHRLSTIVDADLILVMQDGTIVEQGDHRTLLRAGGAYAELYNSQFA